jgi:ketosteroid isomerase-like protein
MSQENVETARLLIERISLRDYDSVAKYLAPDAQWHNTNVFPGPTSIIGAEAIVEFLRDLYEAYRGGSSRIEIEERVDAGETVVVGLHGWGHGMSSGVPIDTRWAHVLQFRGPKVVRVDTYGRYAKALEAAGLAE